MIDPNRHLNARILGPDDPRIRQRRIISIAELLEQRNQHPLTGLANRVWLDEKLPIIIEDNQGRVAILAMDLNNLKQINDEHGHQAGDEYLLQTAMNLRNTTKDDPEHPDRQGDVVVHTGGDEFIIIAPGITDEEKMQILINKIQESLQAVGISASIDGVIHIEGESSNELLKRADDKMIATKGRKKFEGLTYKQGLDVIEILDIAKGSGINIRDIPMIEKAMQAGLIDRGDPKN